MSRKKTKAECLVREVEKEIADHAAEDSDRLTTQYLKSFGKRVWDEGPDHVGLALDLLESSLPESEKYKVLEACDVSAGATWCWGYHSDHREDLAYWSFPQDKIVGVFESKEVPEAWKVSTLSLAMDRERNVNRDFGVSFVPLEYHGKDAFRKYLGMRRTYEALCGSRTWAEFETRRMTAGVAVDEDFLLYILHGGPEWIRDELENRGMVDWLRGDVARRMLFRLILIYSNYSNGRDRDMLEGVAWLERREPGLVRNSVDRYGNNVLVYHHTSYWEQDEVNGRMSGEWAREAIDDAAELESKYGIDRRRENIFGISRDDLRYGVICRDGKYVAL